MAVDFPTSPSNGQTFTSGNITYTYNATAGLWNSAASGGGGGGSSVTVSDTAPTSPSAGDQWFDSTDGSLSVYYNDGSSSQWISTSGPAGAAGTDGTDGSSGSPTSYANFAAFPSSGNTNGDIAYANDTYGVYMWSNSTWQRMSVGSNSGPIFTKLPPSTLQLLNDGTGTVSITVAAIDEGAFPVTYDWDAYSGTTLYDSSSLPPQVTAVSESGGVFTLTGSDSTSNAGGFSFRSKASDGVSITTAITTCNLAFLNGTLLRTHTSDSPTQNDYYGWSVALANNYYAVIESEDDNASATSAGAVFIYNMSDGSQRHKLLPEIYAGDDDLQSDRLRKVVMNDTHTIVGTHYADDGSFSNVGIVRIFNTVTGNLERNIQPPTSDREAYLYFGWSMSLSPSGTYLIVGAYGHDATGGKAYVYNTSTGNLVYTLANPNTETSSIGDNYGSDVAIGDTYIAVGASLEDNASYTNSGVVHVYNLSDGSLRHTIVNPAALTNTTRFGEGVEISDTHLAISAPRQQDASGNATSGKVYVYNPDTGNLRYTINNPNTTSPASDMFGDRVAMSNNYILVSAPDAQTGGGGPVYVYNRYDGSLLYTINNPNSDTSDTQDEFGNALAISDARILVGARNENSASVTKSGAAYLFD